MTNPYLFIVGCPRSGTTLLQRMVNEHPAMAVTPETHWLPRVIDKRWGVTPQGLVTAEIIPRLLELPGFVALNIRREDLARLLGNGQPVTYAAFVSNVFDLYGAAHGKRLVGDKTPGYVRRMNTLHGLWPKARFVHLIRDGRDVYLSMAGRPMEKPKPGIFDSWAESPSVTAALWWELNVQRGRDCGRQLGPDLYYEIRYESLIANPRDESARLCAFLGLPFSERMLEFYERHPTAQAEPGKPEWQPITAGGRDWTSQMTAADVERFEAAAGTLLDELGYVRVVSSPRAEYRQAAAQLRESMLRDPRALYGSERREKSRRSL